MSKKNPVWRIVHGKIYVDSEIRKNILIGSIHDNTLFVTDRDNWDLSTQSLGIDVDVLESPELKYTFISIKFKGEDLTTTRYYFYNKGEEKAGSNTRKMIYLRIKDFGTVRALSLEKEDYLAEIGQYDIFEIGERESKGEKGPKGVRLLEYWEQAIENINKEIEKEIKPKIKLGE